MPLIKSGSAKAKSENISKEIAAGKPQKQAVAIALDIARRYGKKRADGGQTWKPTALSPADEAKFLSAFKATPFYKEFTARYGEQPNIGPDSDYDYRGWWRDNFAGSGRHKDGTIHGPSKDSQGNWLKSPQHPTAWKQRYMDTLGVNPDEIGWDATFASGGPVDYALKKGENPSIVAKRFGIPLGELMALNGLTDESARKLKVGQRLLLRPPPPPNPKASGPVVKETTGRGNEAFPVLPNKPEIELPEADPTSLGGAGSGPAMQTVVETPPKDFNPTVKSPSEEASALVKSAEWKGGTENPEPIKPVEIPVEIATEAPKKPSVPGWEPETGDRPPRQEPMVDPRLARDLLMMLESAGVATGAAPIGRMAMGALAPLYETATPFRGEAGPAVRRMMDALGWYKKKFPGGDPKSWPGTDRLPVRREPKWDAVPEPDLEPPMMIEPEPYTGPILRDDGGRVVPQSEWPADILNPEDRSGDVSVFEMPPFVGGRMALPVPPYPKERLWKGNGADLDESAPSWYQRTGSGGPSEGFLNPQSGGSPYLIPVGTVINFDKARQKLLEGGWMPQGGGPRAGGGTPQISRLPNPVGESVNRTVAHQGSARSQYAKSKLEDDVALIKRAMNDPKQVKNFNRAFMKLTPAEQKRLMEYIFSPRARGGATVFKPEWDPREHQPPGVTMFEFEEADKRIRDQQIEDETYKNIDLEGIKVRASGGQLPKSVIPELPKSKGLPAKSAMVTRGASIGMAVRKGLIGSSSPGRADKLGVKLQSGSYVLPADTVSHYGQGNTLAGAAALDKLFRSGPYGSMSVRIGSPRTGFPKAPMDVSFLRSPKLGYIRSDPVGYKRADGGPTTGEVPVAISGGEYVVPPESVLAVGKGDMERGFRVLDQFVLQSRKKDIKTLKKLAPPKKD